MVSETKELEDTEDVAEAKVVVAQLSCAKRTVISPTAPLTLPVAEKTYLFRVPYYRFYLWYPKKVDLFGYRWL